MAHIAALSKAPDIAVRRALKIANLLPMLLDLLREDRLDYEQAKVQIERAARISAQNPSTFVQMGYISANLKDWSMALRSFQRARQLITKKDADASPDAGEDA